MMGIQTPDRGNIRFHPNTDVAYYAQELEQLDLQKTVLENVQTDGYTIKQLRSVLSNFLFYEDDICKKAEVLSPGEKARVCLCRVLLQKANFWSWMSLPITWILKRRVSLAETSTL